MEDWQRYRPKPNLSYHRPPPPFSLKSLCIRKVIPALLRENNPQEFIKDLPTTLLEDMLRSVKECFLRPADIIRLMVIFPPEISINHLDMIGNYNGTDCCERLTYRRWLYGFFQDFGVGRDSIEKLCEILKKCELSKLTKIGIWSLRGAIIPEFRSLFPNAINLTQVVLRGDTNDALLRTIGLHCNHVKLLDISRSPLVSQRGLLGLLMLIPDATIESRWFNKLNPIATNLLKFVISYAMTNAEDMMDFAERMSDFGKGPYECYVVPCVPEFQVIRIQEPNIGTGHEYKLENPVDPRTRCLMESIIGPELTTQVQSTLNVTLISSYPDLELDFYKPTHGKQLKILARKLRTPILTRRLVVEIGVGLVELDLFSLRVRIWDNQHLIQLNDLYSIGQNLRKFSGRIEGAWTNKGFSRKWLLPNLEDLNCWTLHDNSAITILQYCPKLRYADLRIIQNTIVNGPNGINDDLLQEIAKINPQLLQNIEELSVRPTALTPTSVEYLIDNCPKILRIGDLECWNISTEEIQELNRRLANKISKCYLTVLNYPPSSRNHILTPF